MRNAKPLWSRLGTLLALPFIGLDLWTNQLFGFSLFGTLGHGKPDFATPEKSERLRPRSPIPSLTEHLPSTGFPVCFVSNTNHEEDQPVHLVLRDPAIPITVNLPEYAEPAQRYCPGGRLRGCRGQLRATLPDQCAELRALQNLRHQGSGAEYHLGHARRRRRTQLYEYVGADLRKIVASAGSALCCWPAAPRQAAGHAPPRQPDAQADAFSTYLSARFAAGEHDMPQAARYYGQSLNNDPANADLLALAFFYSTTSGDFDAAAAYAAQRWSPRRRDDRAARLALAVIAFKHKDYAEVAQAICRFRPRAFHHSRPCRCSMPGPRPRRAMPPPPPPT